MKRLAIAVAVSVVCLSPPAMSLSISREEFAAAMACLDRLPDYTEADAEYRRTKTASDASFKALDRALTDDARGQTRATTVSEKLMQYLPEHFDAALALHQMGEFLKSVDGRCSFAVNQMLDFVNRDAGTMLERTARLKEALAIVARRPRQVR